MSTLRTAPNPQLPDSSVEEFEAALIKVRDVWQSKGAKGSEKLLDMVALITGADLVCLRPTELPLRTPVRRPKDGVIGQPTCG